MRLDHFFRTFLTLVILANLSSGCRNIRDVIFTAVYHARFGVHGSTWLKKYGDKYLQKLIRRRLKSISMFHNFVALAEAVREGGGTVSFEWPRHCFGWVQEPVMEFIHIFQLQEAMCDGCAFGMEHDREPLLKPWRIVTDHPLLAHNLSKH